MTDYGDYDASVCENCKHAKTIESFDPATYVTEYDTECLVGHRHVAEYECNDFEKK